MRRDFQFVNLSPDLLLAQHLDASRAEEFSYNGIGRSKRLTVAQANADAARVWRDWARHGRIGKLLDEWAVTPNARPLKNDVVGNVGTTLRLLMGALGLLMLLVCANLADLVLVRSRARQQEFAVRAALGPGGGRSGTHGRRVRTWLRLCGVRLLATIGPSSCPGCTRSRSDRRRWCSRGSAPSARACCSGRWPLWESADHPCFADEPVADIVQRGDPTPQIELAPSRRRSRRVAVY